MGLLADGTKLLADLQHDTDGEIVEISRPGVFGPRECVLVPSSLATQIDATTNLPVRVEADREDFLFRAVDLLAALGLGVVLQANDRIDRIVGGRLNRYVLVADESGPAWEYDDPDQITVRAHARLVEVT